MKVLRTFGELCLNQGSLMANGLYNITHTSLLENNNVQGISDWFDAEIKDELMSLDDREFEIECNKLLGIKVTLLMGEFTFLDIENDGEHKTIIHKITEVFLCNSIDEAESLGEDLLDTFESYLVPTSYTGEIDITQMEAVGFETNINL